MQTTKLHFNDLLPLTCSRKGTCCHGNQVLLNPWELFCLANEKKISTKEFRDLYCEFGGIRLLFNGNEDHRNKKACSQYIPNFGCSVHEGRPLACRLFPLGRQIQNNTVEYIHQTEKFPCLDGCPEVVSLPHIKVGDYLKGQKTATFENAQDQYLEVMQNIADIAFELLLDTGLSTSGDTKTLALWRILGNESPETLANRIETDWLDCLTIPNLNESDPMLFVQKHNELLMDKIQTSFGTLQSHAELHLASTTLMALALQLARAIGANPKELAELWIDTAKNYGALE